MMLIRDHDVQDYADLLDMDATDVGMLNEDDRGCLRELGEYLVTTESWQRFAVWLLHKHFDPHNGEIFVECATPESRGIETTLVEQSSSLAQGVSASGFRFDSEVDSNVSVIAMEFAASADFGPTSPLCPDDETVLAGIAERLRAYGKIDRFGVKLIRNPLGLSKRDLLVETCDTAHRTLRCDVIARDAVPGDRDVVETTWQWKVIQGGSQPVVMQNCNTACIAGVEGHDLRHGVSGTDNDDNPFGPVYP
ncbi:MAG: hypothetical protein ACJ74F_02085 [Mycobacterium sp.]|uniref:hypothetical protein n=1 Tax=Mycobacterium sp. TaxID=1785 RepID=UPI00389A3291